MARRAVLRSLALLPLVALLAGGVPPVAAEGAADLAITIVADRKMAKVGEPITYTITVTNLGPAAAADIGFALSLPDDLNPVSVTCGSEPAAGPFCTVAALPAGARFTATQVATPSWNAKKRDELTTTTAVIASFAPATTDPNPANNLASATVGVNGRPSSH